MHSTVRVSNEYTAQYKINSLSLCKLLIWGCLHFSNSSCLTVFPLRNIWTYITEFDSFVFVFYKQVGVFMGEVFICIYWGSVVSEEKANVIPPIRLLHLFHHTSPVRPLRTSVQNFSIVHETHLENLFNFCILKIQLTRRPEKKQFRSNQILLFYFFWNPIDHSYQNRSTKLLWCFMVYCELELSLFKPFSKFLIF